MPENIDENFQKNYNDFESKLLKAIFQWSTVLMPIIFFPLYLSFVDVKWIT